MWIEIWTSLASAISIHVGKQAPYHFVLCTEVVAYLYTVHFHSEIHLACSQGIQIHH
jgi:hypothetical protein